MEGDQNSSSSSSLDKLASSFHNTEIEKLVHVRDGFLHIKNGLENQVKLFLDFLEKPSENTRVLLKTISVLVKKSRAQSLRTSDENLTVEETSSTSSKNSEISEVEQLQKFVESVKGAIKIFTFLQDDEQDENLATVLKNINMIVESSSKSNNTFRLSKDALTSKTSPENITHNENLIDSNAKRQKVIHEDKNETVDLFRREENPLENDVILKLLFHWFADYDLYDFRLVSRKWNNITTAALKKAEPLLILMYDSVEKTYIKSNSNFAPLSQLNKILPFSQNFPIVNFRFECGDLGSSEAKEFFKIHGEKIKRLSLDLRNEDDENIPHTSITTFRMILLEYATNIKELKLWSIPKEWCEDNSLKLFPEPRNMIQLPKLTTLILKMSKFTTEKSYKVVQDIIQAAVNLKTIRGYKIEFLDPSATAFENKISAVKNIDFNPTEENLDLYSKFAEGNPKLERMEISLDILNNNNVQVKKKTFECFQMIFESSKDTLTSITNLPPLSHLHNFKFPLMGKMKDINFADQKDRTVFNWIIDFQGIPCPLKLGQIFPNLEQVWIDLESPQDSEHGFNFFDYAEPVPSVTLLYVGYETTPLFVEKLAALFPAVENLELNMNLSDFNQIMPVIWKGFSNVKELTLEIYKYAEDEIITADMDSGITGFSPETCIQLKNNLKTAKLEDIEALRENPSILDATKLETFTINFKFHDEDEVFSGPIFSTATGIFGFNLVKKVNGLTVQISTTDEAERDRNLDVGISEIAHYVNID